MQTQKLLVITGITFLMAGCKLAVIVVEGGEVQSTAAGTCVAGMQCIVEVTLPVHSFSETFTAVPDVGWYFEKWNSGYGFLCGDSTDKECFVSNEGADLGDLNVMRLLASDWTFYLMPVFWPKPPTVTIDGKVWLRPEDFPYTAEEISAICPPPSGVCSGRLPIRLSPLGVPGGNFDLSGYTWASVEEVITLYNGYGVDPPFTDTAGDQIRGEQAAVDSMADNFYFSYDLVPGFHGGILRDPTASEDTIYATSEIHNPPDNNGSIRILVENERGQTGPWLWKPVGEP